jgi:hypothetical protein
MNRDDIDRGNQHRCGRRTPQLRRDNQAEEDPVVQAVSGVDTVISVVLLLLRCLRRR